MSTGNKLLLHACCGPCSTACLERLSDDYEVTVFFYNPNIEPEEEYRHRAETLKSFIARYPAKNPIHYIEGDYDPEMFRDLVQGLEREPEGGARCTKCFEMRLSEAARLAAEGDYDCFTTTLTISPHKNAKLINEIGERLAAETGAKWMYSDFKKKDGFLRSIRLSQEYELYRQDYCGCVFSIRRD